MPGRNLRENASEIERWTARRKAALVLDVLKGNVSEAEACRTFGIDRDEYRGWHERFVRGGTDALKVDKRRIEDAFRFEIRRLQAKIGELVMERDRRTDDPRARGSDDVDRPAAGASPIPPAHSSKPDKN